MQTFRADCNIQISNVVPNIYEETLPVANCFLFHLKCNLYFQKPIQTEQIQTGSYFQWPGRGQST